MKAKKKPTARKPARKRELLKPATEPTAREREITIARLNRILDVLVEANPFEVYEICTAILAANDVLNGTPYWSTNNVPIHMTSQVNFFLKTAREFMCTYQRLPSLIDLMNVYVGRTEVKLRTYVNRSMN